MSKPLAGRIALVTGGSRGVGRGIALRLAADGAAVAVNYRRDTEAAKQTVADIEAAGGVAVPYSASIDDPDAVAAMVDSVRADLGPVDLLVSNAGTASRGKPIAHTDQDEYLRLFRVHALGPLDLVHRLLPELREAGRADVVIVSSVLSTHFPANCAPYTMAKVAIEAAARTLAKEEREHGIRVHIVAPGLVATDMGERLVAAGGRTLAEVESEFPFGRVARPADVAGVISFLASADAEYLTGQRIEIDGGGPDGGVTG